MHTIHLGEILYCNEDPAIDDGALVHVQQGALVVDNTGRITQSGDASILLEQYPGAKIVDHGDGILVPGFIDTHIHFPQVNIISSWGAQLLDWLNTYTFPAELAFEDPEHAAETAEFFLDELLRNGTTTALVFGSVHKTSVDAFFSAAQKRHLCMIAGKVLMDRNAPEGLRDNPQSAYDDSAELINRWHGRERLKYAVTPRFAPTSTPEQLHAAGRLLKDFPDVLLHTHLAENTSECAWVSELFPDSCDYLDVYDQAQLLGPRSVFAHSIHLSERAWKRLAQTQSNIAHCPCSNLFIGSGLFSLAKARQHGIHVGLGTDVGGGDSFSLLRTCNESYKMQQLQGLNVKPHELLYLATLGGAKTLGLSDELGRLSAGNWADFVVLDPASTPLIERRIKACKTIEERLFALLMLGDDRSIRATYILGEAAHLRDQKDA